MVLGSTDRLALIDRGITGHGDILYEYGGGMVHEYEYVGVLYDCEGPKIFFFFHISTLSFVIVSLSSLTSIELEQAIFF